MARLVWESLGVGVLSAWYREDGTEARCLLRIENAGWPHAFRVSAWRPLEAAFEPLVLTLRHSAFDLDRAKDFAELLEAEFPAVAHDEPALGELLERHRQELARLQPPRPERCAFVHAWPPGAGDRAVCQCGRITKGLARERGLAVLA